ncbi:hypothetical protein LSTR_LSTR009648 [Laodelphax striatellus]|uniref:Uncharacterized protein n=1 Tax=Laodelphax striatellus TaxID=195883 RepID=A0A482WP48_LAOST|nr:hypothetical protein LSTR_LSTR009648 [Laodelphax striatellus]
MNKHPLIGIVQKLEDRAANTMPNLQEALSEKDAVIAKLTSELKSKTYFLSRYEYISRSLNANVGDITDFFVRYQRRTGQQLLRGSLATNESLKKRCETANALVKKLETEVYEKENIRLRDEMFIKQYKEIIEERETELENARNDLHKQKIANLALERKFKELLRSSRRLGKIIEKHGIPLSKLDTVALNKIQQQSKSKDKVSETCNLEEDCIDDVELKILKNQETQTNELIQYSPILKDYRKLAAYTEGLGILSPSLTNDSGVGLSPGLSLSGLSPVSLDLNDSCTRFKESLQTYGPQDQETVPVNVDPDKDLGLTEENYVDNAPSSPATSVFDPEPINHDLLMHDSDFDDGISNEYLDEMLNDASEKFTMPVLNELNLSTESSIGVSNADVNEDHKKEVENNESLKHNDLLSQETLYQDNKKVEIRKYRDYIEVVIHSEEPELLDEQNRKCTDESSCIQSNESEYNENKLSGASEMHDVVVPKTEDVSREEPDKSIPVGGELEKVIQICEKSNFDTVPTASPMIERKLVVNNEISQVDDINVCGEMKTDNKETGIIPTEIVDESNILSVTSMGTGFEEMSSLQNNSGISFCNDHSYAALQLCDGEDNKCKILITNEQSSETEIVEADEIEQGTKICETLIRDDEKGQLSAISNSLSERAVDNVIEGKFEPVDSETTKLVCSKQDSTAPSCVSLVSVEEKVESTINSQSNLANEGEMQSISEDASQSQSKCTDSNNSGLESNKNARSPTASFLPQSNNELVKRREPLAKSIFDLVDDSDRDSNSPVNVLSPRKGLAFDDDSNSRDLEQRSTHTTGDATQFKIPEISKQVLDSNNTSKDEISKAYRKIEVVEDKVLDKIMRKMQMKSIFKGPAISPIPPSPKSSKQEPSIQRELSMLSSDEDKNSADQLRYVGNSTKSVQKAGKLSPTKKDDYRGVHGVPHLTKDENVVKAPRRVTGDQLHNAGSNLTPEFKFKKPISVVSLNELSTGISIHSEKATKRSEDVIKASPGCSEPNHSIGGNSSSQTRPHEKSHFPKHRDSKQVKKNGKQEHLVSFKTENSVDDGFKSSTLKLWPESQTSKSFNNSSEPSSLGNPNCSLVDQNTSNKTSSTDNIIVEDIKPTPEHSQDDNSTSSSESGPIECDFEKVLAKIRQECYVPECIDKMPDSDSASDVLVLSDVLEVDSAQVKDFNSPLSPDGVENTAVFNSPLSPDCVENTAVFNSPLSPDCVENTAVFNSPLSPDGVEHTAVFNSPLSPDVTEHTEEFTSSSQSCEMEYRVGQMCEDETGILSTNAINQHGDDLKEEVLTPTKNSTLLEGNPIVNTESETSYTSNKECTNENNKMTTKTSESAESNKVSPNRSISIHGIEKCIESLPVSNNLRELDESNLKDLLPNEPNEGKQNFNSNLPVDDFQQRTFAKSIGTSPVSIQHSDGFKGFDSNGQVNRDQSSNGIAQCSSEFVPVDGFEHCPSNSTENRIESPTDSKNLSDSDEPAFKGWAPNQLVKEMEAIQTNDGEQQTIKNRHIKKKETISYPLRRSERILKLLENGIHSPPEKYCLKRNQSSSSKPKTSEKLNAANKLSPAKVSENKVSNRVKNFILKMEETSKYTNTRSRSLPTSFYSIITRSRSRQMNSPAKKRCYCCDTIATEGISKESSPLKRRSRSLLTLNCSSSQTVRTEVSSRLRNGKKLKNENVCGRSPRRRSHPFYESNRKSRRQMTIDKMRTSSHFKDSNQTSPLNSNFSNDLNNDAFKNQNSKEISPLTGNMIIDNCQDIVDDNHDKSDGVLPIDCQEDSKDENDQIPSRNDSEMRSVEAAMPSNCPDSDTRTTVCRKEDPAIAIEQPKCLRRSPRSSTRIASQNSNFRHNLRTDPVPNVMNESAEVQKPTIEKICKIKLTDLNYNLRIDSVPSVTDERANDVSYCVKNSEEVSPSTVSMMVDNCEDIVDDDTDDVLLIDCQEDSKDENQVPVSTNDEIQSRNDAEMTSGEEASMQSNYRDSDIPTTVCRNEGKRHISAITIEQPKSLRRSLRTSTRIASQDSDFRFLRIDPVPVIYYSSVDESDVQKPEIGMECPSHNSATDLNLKIDSDVTDENAASPKPSIETVPAFNFYSEVSETTPSEQSSKRRSVSPDIDAKRRKISEDAVAHCPEPMPSECHPPMDPNDCEKIHALNFIEEEEVRMLPCDNVITMAYHYHRRNLFKNGKIDNSSPDESQSEKGFEEHNQLAEEVFIRVAKSRLEEEEEEEDEEKCLEEKEDTVEYWTSEVLEACLEKLKDIPNNVISDLIIDTLYHDEEAPDTDAAAPLSDLQKKVITIAYELCSGRPQFFNALLMSFRDILLLNTFEYVDCYCRFVRFLTLLCRALHKVEEMRWFVYDALYLKIKSGLPMAYTALIMWPSILPMASPIETACPLALCISYVLRTNSIHDRLRKLYKVDKINHMLNKYYGYTEIDSNAVFNHIMESIHMNIDGALEALVLLCKRIGPKWTLTHVVDSLTPILNEWKMNKNNGEGVALVIRVLSYVLRPFLQGTHSAKVNGLIREIGTFLFDPEADDRIQTVAAESLCRLSKGNMPLCTELLIKWKPPRGKVSLQLIKQMRAFIARRKPAFWLSEMTKNNLIKSQGDTSL